jgi:hypothetical protein
MRATHQTPPSAASVADAAQQGAEAQLFERIGDLAPVIHEHAATAEQDRHLPKPVLQALIAGGFQHTHAAIAGGFKLDPVSCTSVVEEIAGLDSAAAWALQAPNVTVWWASKLSAQGAEELYGSDPSRMMAEVRGKSDGYCKGKSGSLHISVKELGVILTSTIVGGELSLATGVGLSLSMQDTGGIAACFFGDGAARTAMMRYSKTSSCRYSAVSSSIGLQLGRNFQGPLYRFPAVGIIALFTCGVLLATARNDRFRDLAVGRRRSARRGASRSSGVQAALAEAEERSVRLGRSSTGDDGNVGSRRPACLTRSKIERICCSPRSRPGRVPLR